MRMVWIAACASLLLVAGCLPAGMPVPGSAGADRVVFMPGEEQVLIHAEDAVSLYDLASKRFVWRRRVAGKTGISASRGYFALAQLTPPGPGVVTVFRSSDGAQLLKADLEHPPPYLDESTPRLVAVSDDGKWLGVATYRHEEQAWSVALQPLGGGAVESLTNPERGVDTIAFEPGGQRLAIAWRGQVWQIVVYRRTTGGWKPDVTFEQAACPSWVRGGLGFVTTEGYYLWSSNVKRSIAPATLTIDDFDFCNRWKFSGDGAYLAAWDGWKLTVRDTRSGAALIDFAWPQEQPAGVCGAAFYGARFRAFVCAGTFVELDLAARRKVRTVWFGSPGSYERTLFGEGASYTPNYDAYLSPRGTYVDVVGRYGGHVLYNMD